MRQLICDECGATLGGEWRRICCGCGKALHDNCWINDRLERAYRSECDWGTCECGGGFNLYAWNVKITACEAPEVEGVYAVGCRCERD